jgi:lipopolysaccharide biosynthesis glycosyltransferase|tara:strand:+ start:159 stop:926 length:768 start_codon:yes stop_codon:yes gene_type:complete
MKNIVFIPNINLGNGRNKSYHYSIDSWKQWCEKNNCELIVWEDLLYPVDYMKITWQRYYLFDILEANDIDYNQILMVDADTIVHPDCPNFFELTDNKYCGVMNEGDYEWVLRSIRGFGDELFNGKRIKPWNYINGGFQILNKTHKDFYKKVLEYYKGNSDKIIDTIAKLKTATDQTIINFLLVENNIDVKILPDCYNLVDLYRKNLLYLDTGHWWSDELHFLEAGWVYHFNAIPPNSMGRDVSYWMERTYKELYK